MIESTVATPDIDDLDMEDLDMEDLDDEQFHRDLSETVATLPGASSEDMQRYADKMKMLDDIHIEVFGPPKPIEWDHDDSMDFKYVEPFQAYRLSGGSAY